KSTLPARLKVNFPRGHIRAAVFAVLYIATVPIQNARRHSPRRGGKMIRPILINGKFVKAQSNSAIDVHNPATLAPLDSVPACGEADVNAAVKAARNAQLAWWRTSGVEKAELLHEVATRIRERRKAIAIEMTQETGKPLVEAVDCVKWVAESFDYFAEVGRAAQGPVVAPGADHQVNFVRKEPYGVVACIAPFNFPLLL